VDPPSAGSEEQDPAYVVKEMRRFLLRLRNVWRRDRADDDLGREIASHLALLEDEQRRRGLSEREAHFAARRAMGSIALAKDRHRDARSFAWLEDAISDVRHSVRGLRRTPAFTGIAVLTLALGIGANTAIFSVVNAVLLRPLPFEHADRLVRVVMTIPAQVTGATERRAAVRLSPMEIDQLRTSARTLSMAGMAEATLMNLRGRDPRLQGAIVSAAFFETLRPRPLLGRVFVAADEAADASPVILLSYDTWRRHFGEDPQIVGRTLTFDPVLGPRVSTDYTVIGVMPENFQFPNRETRVWTPPRVDAIELDRVPRVAMLAQLAEGVSLAAAESEIPPLVRQIRARYRDNTNANYELVGVQPELVRPVKPALVVLTVAVGFVLLLACVNVANLLLARTASRQREIAIRGALGAGRGRLIRYFLTESMTLALCGGLVGALLAFGGVRLLRSLATTLTRVDLGDQLSIPRIDEIGVDWTVLAFSFAVSIATGVLFGLAPALRYARPDDAVALREGERTTGGGSRLGRYVTLRSALVIAEIGLAMVLLAGGGLLIRSFVELSRVDAGYDPSNVVTFQVAIPFDLYPPARAKAFAEDLVATLQSVPGVESAAYANQLPMVSLVNSFPLGPRPRPRPEPGRPPAQAPEGMADIRLVSRDYVKAMGIRVLSGRGFAESDGAGAPRVMLINEALARRDFANRSPIGETVFVNYFPEPWQVVGVIADVRQFGLSVEPTPQFFVDMRQWTDVDALVFPAGAYYAVRTTATAESILPSVRAIVRQMDPQASLFYIAPMEELVASTISRPRLYATLLGVFSAVGLGLAVIGIYGVMTYSVAQRTREIGIRVALGARQTQVISLVLGQSALLTFIGIVLGLAGAAMLSRYLEGLLYGVTPLDPATFAAATAFFALAALVAAYGPVRRATGVDPLVALRAE
jgi:putative ABC transport system permease protein